MNCYKVEVTVEKDGRREKSSAVFVAAEDVFDACARAGKAAGATTTGIAVKLLGKLVGSGK